MGCESVGLIADACAPGVQVEEARHQAEEDRLAAKRAYQQRLAEEQADLKKRLGEAGSKGRDSKVQTDLDLLRPCDHAQQNWTAFHGRPGTMLCRQG